MEGQAQDLLRFGVALAIGALVGTERQLASDRDAAAARSRAVELAGAPPQPAAPSPEELDLQRVAGVRTFTLVALAGATAARLAPAVPWLFPAALLVVGALLVSGYQGAVRVRGDLGLTSTVSSLLVFLLGALAVHGETTLAGACGVFVAGILSLKQGLHAIAGRVRTEDVQALLKFAVLTVVILPVLPERRVTVDDVLTLIRPPAAAPEGEGDIEAMVPAAPSVAPVASAAPVTGAAPATPPPAGATAWWRRLGLRPQRLWLTVVLFSGVSFAGYVLAKVLGAGRGLMVTAALGGLVSSTAVTVALAQRSRGAPEASARLTTGIVLANAIFPARLLLLVALVNGTIAARLFLPTLAMILAAGILIAALGRRAGEAHVVDVALRNPFEIRPALTFGALYATVLLGVQVVEHLLGPTGLYLLAAVAGLPDADPVSLVACYLALDGRLTTDAAVGIVAVAVAANTVGKAGFAVTAGAPALQRLVPVCLAVILAAGAATLGALLAVG